MHSPEPGKGGFDPSQPLRRSRADVMLFGVCGGLAEWLQWDATAVRLAFVLVTVFTGVVPGLLVYIAAMILMPKHAQPSTRDGSDVSPRDPG